MTKTEFRQKAFAQPITVAGQPLAAKPVQHKTGSLGFTWKGAFWVNVGGQDIKVLGSFTATAVGSKKWSA